MPFVNSTLFFRFCLPCFLFTMIWNKKIKNKIRCIDAPKYVFTHRNLPESEKYTWIIQNVHEVSILLYIESRATRHSAVSAFTEPRINAFDIMLQHDWLLFFLDIVNRFAETHSHLQLSYHITDRLLVASNNLCNACSGGYLMGVGLDVDLGVGVDG